MKIATYLLLLFVFQLRGESVDMLTLEGLGRYDPKSKQMAFETTELLTDALLLRFVKQVKGEVRQLHLHGCTSLTGQGMANAISNINHLECLSVTWCNDGMAAVQATAKHHRCSIRKINVGVWVTYMSEKEYKTDKLLQIMNAKQEVAFYEDSPVKELANCPKLTQLFLGHFYDHKSQFKAELNVALSKGKLGQLKRVCLGSDGQFRIAKMKLVPDERGKKQSLQD